MDFFDALTLVFAIYAFITALLLFVAQTENYNRVSHYWRKKGNRAWMVVFNSSRRHLVDKAFFVPLHFTGKGLTLIRSQAIDEDREAENCRFVPKDDDFELSFDYLSPKSAVVAEFETTGPVKRPKIRGILKGGRLVKCHFWFDDIAHCTPLILIGYAAFCAIVICTLRRLLHLALITHAAFWVYVIATVVLAVGVYWFFCKHRRIFVKEYWAVRRFMRGKLGGKQL